MAFTLPAGFSAKDLRDFKGGCSGLRERTNAEESLIEFTKQAWHVIEPGVVFRPNWHLDVIAEHLQAVSSGEITDLLINIPPGCMKLCADSTVVPTPQGYRTHGELAPGDYVFGPDGLPTRIRAVTPQGVADYEVEFSNGEIIKCNGEHLWAVQDKFNGRKDGVYSVKELLQRGAPAYYEKSGKMRYRYSIQDREPLRYPEKKLPLDPYFFGCWLGDGRSTGTDISHDKDDTAHIDKIIARGMVVSKTWGATERTRYTSFAKQGVRQIFRGIGVLNNKHIPEDFLIASVEQRLELLAGLIDTDGSVDKIRGRCSITACSPRLAFDIQRLVISLGFRPHVTLRAVPEYGSYSSEKIAHVILFEPNREIPTAIPRKKIHRISALRRRVAITRIEKTANPEVGHCINVERGDGLYLVGEKHVTTHNSILVSVMWPAWEWARDPSQRYLGASYGEDLALRDSMKCRDIITSEWYQQNWGKSVKIKAGEDMKIKYALTGGGWRMASSVGGRATGEHPSRKIVDDPHSAMQAQSDAERQRALDWFDGTLSTRGASRGAATVVVMQRLHEKDISGHILEDLGGYTHLCLPMKYIKNKYSYGKDPRKKEGDLLWGEMFPAKMVSMLEKRLGEYGAAGQLQQQPAPPGGGILKTENFRIWPISRPIPQFQFILQSYDTAFTERTTGDPTACTVWGVFSENNRQSVMLLDCWAEHLSYPDLRDRVVTEWNSEYGGDKNDQYNRPRRADLLLIEEKGSGISLIQDLRRSGVGVRTYNPGRMDKISRAHQFAPMLELGVLYIPESAKNKGEFTTWAKKLLTQMEKFPNAEHDDLVDTTSMAFIYLRDAKLLELPYVKVVDDEFEIDYEKSKRVRSNPYAA